MSTQLEALHHLFTPHLDPSGTIPGSTVARPAKQTPRSVMVTHSGRRNNRYINYNNLPIAVTACKADTLMQMLDRW